VETSPYVHAVPQLLDDGKSIVYIVPLFKRDTWGDNWGIHRNNHSRRVGIRALLDHDLLDGSVFVDENETA